MKNLILILTVFVISVSAGYAQPKKMNEELKKIRKEKFIESVSVDEATADKYFDLFDENFNALMKLSKQKKDNLEYVEKNYDASDVTAKLDEIIEIDSKILEKKKELYFQLKTFLTPKQLAQTVVFQVKFTRELKNEIEKKKNEK